MALSVHSEELPDLKPGLLARAFLLSILIHLTGFGAWKIAQRLHLMDNLNLAALVRQMERKVMNAPPQEPPKAPEQQPIELAFNIDADTPSPTAPEKAKYYGPVNTRAANVTEQKKTDDPNLDGPQTKIVRTASAQTTKTVPLQPTPVQPKETSQDQEEKKQRSQPKFDLGNVNLAQVKPDPLNTPKKDEPGTEVVTKHVHPRLLSEVQHSHQGEAMKQDGGVRRIALSTLDTKGSIIGDYDREFVDAVQSRWYTLLEDHPNLSAGHVVLQFVMHPDGGISDMALISQTVGEDLLWEMCERAVMDPAPFRKWPAEMRREIGSDRREVRFTFYYE